MHLKYIKLAGFKSFADAVRVEIHGNLTGVVGPNGCGKSNVIDAVRWVLGERSLSKLRGSEMTDVIFNGSQGRNPLGRASVELFFDNEKGEFGGLWSSYPELTIRRELIRASGQSSYSINGKTVRLKDIQKIFTGTGLGSSAPYAIIGQGDITEIIESRPEDMRARLEEAAGVSYYKQRRQETENSLEASQKNLERITDILAELKVSVDDLEKQASAALSYSELSKERREKFHLWLFLQFRKAKEELEHAEAELEELNETLEIRCGALAADESKLSLLREKTGAAKSTLIELQGRKKAQEVRIAGINREIEIIAERRKFLEADNKDRKAEKERCANDRDSAERQEKETASVLTDLESEIRSSAEALSQTNRRCAEKERRLSEEKGVLDGLYKKVRNLERNLQETQAEKRTAKAGGEEIQKRLSRLEKELESIPQPQRTELAKIQSEIEKYSEEAAGLREKLRDKETQERTLSKNLSEAEKLFREASGALQGIKTQLNALMKQQALAENALNSDPSLQKSGIDVRGVLASRLTVRKGWETAFERFLGERLRAEIVSREDLKKISGLNFSKTSVFVAQKSGGEADSKDSLLNLVGDPETLPRAVQRWLKNIYPADSVEEAYKKLEGLTKDEFVLLQDGTLISRDFIRKPGSSQSDIGILLRKNQIADLSEEAVELERKVKDCNDAVKSSRESYETVRHEISALRALASEKDSISHSLKVKEAALREKNASHLSQKMRIEKDIAEHRARKDFLADRTAKTEVKAAGLERELKAAKSELEIQQNTVRSHTSEIQALRSQSQDRRFQKERLELQLTHKKDSLVQLQSRKKALEDNICRLDKMLERNRKEGEILDESLLLKSRTDEEKEREKLSSLIEGATARVHSAETEERDLAGKIKNEQESLEPLRSRSSQLQKKTGELKANKERFSERLDQEKPDYEFLWEASRKDHPSLAQLKKDWTSLEGRIEALGPVNLRAVEELKTKKERQGLLEEQCKDIREAVAKLNDAIRTIDTETEARLRKTFGQINENFAGMFRKLFHGGSASIEKDQEDFLKAGYIVKAQPPGKRNSTIGALSGGEKALTAIAFVLAIFIMNPAPFCLLDEVDAPLDEANQGRFAELLREMSATTQFLVITHKRVTMEFLERVIGVTMGEPGVSKIVGVDLVRSIKGTIQEDPAPG